MWICKFCIKRMGKETPEQLTFHACSKCHDPMAECAEEAVIFNIESSNWHKYSEGKHCSSGSSDEFEIPENGLYLWLRPIKSTSSKTDERL